MSVKRINIGPRMSDVVIHNGIAYLAGKVPSNTDADIGGQTADVLRQIDELLAQAGTSKSNLLRAEIFLTDIKDFAGMNKVWDAWVDPKATPARATIEAKLARPEFKIEIMVIAAVS
jgi:enamine deaminase RidA (YjgF/YER057c/UK114 family)